MSKLTQQGQPSACAVTTYCTSKRCPMSCSTIPREVCLMLRCYVLCRDRASAEHPKPGGLSIPPIYLRCTGGSSEAQHRQHGGNLVGSVRCRIKGCKECICECPLDNNLAIMWVCGGLCCDMWRLACGRTSERVWETSGRWE